MERILDYSKNEPIPFDWFQKNGLINCFFEIDSIDGKILSTTDRVCISIINLDKQEYIYYKCIRLSGDNKALKDKTGIALLMLLDFEVENGEYKLYTKKFNSIKVSFLNKKCDKIIFNVEEIKGVRCGNKN